MAQNGHGAISDLSPLCAPKRTPADHSEFMGSRPSREIGIGRYYCFTRRIAERMQNIRKAPMALAASLLRKTGEGSTLGAPLSFANGTSIGFPNQPGGLAMPRRIMLSVFALAV